MDQLSGKVVLVTGASSGIGEATARALATAGATVALTARRTDRLKKITQEIVDAGGKAQWYELDITDEKACQPVVEKIESELGPIDILVNNAGMMLLGPVQDAPMDEWHKMLHINVLGLMRMTHAVLPGMTKRKSGHIVNISSVAGRTATAGSAVYNATKWGVNAFTEALRHELVQGGAHVRTTLIEPGAVETELASHNRPEVQETLKTRWKGLTKKLTSEDIAASILYAVSQPPHVNVNEILIRPTEQDN